MIKRHLHKIPQSKQRQRWKPLMMIFRFNSYYITNCSV
jgi:hypothetical protein